MDNQSADDKYQACLKEYKRVSEYLMQRLENSTRREIVLWKEIWELEKRLKLNDTLAG